MLNELLLLLLLHELVDGLAFLGQQLTVRFGLHASTLADLVTTKVVHPCKEPGLLLLTHRRPRFGKEEFVVQHGLQLLGNELNHHLLEPGPWLPKVLRIQLIHDRGQDLIREDRATIDLTDQAVDDHRLPRLHLHIQRLIERFLDDGRGRPTFGWREP